MILITGSSGFVGKNLVRYLNNFGCTTIGVSSLNGTRSDKEYENIFRQGLVSGASAVVHLAGKAHDLDFLTKKEDFYKINTEWTKVFFDLFLASKAEVFIFVSSVKAAADFIGDELTEDYVSNPATVYGKSKLLAEQYILSKNNQNGKRIYILRPCIIHGPGNKGNLNLLYQFVRKISIWPLGVFDNKRSLCSIDNLLFIIKEFIDRNDIPSGVYNVADDCPISTNYLVSFMAKSLNRNVIIMFIPKFLIIFFSRIGDFVQLPLNSDRLTKLTQNYVVSNHKLKTALGKDLPLKTEEGLIKTLNYLKKNL